MNNEEKRLKTVDDLFKLFHENELTVGDGWAVLCAASSTIAAREFDFDDDETFLHYLDTILDVFRESAIQYRNIKSQEVGE